MLKLNYFLADIFILSAEKQPIKLSWRKIEWLPLYTTIATVTINLIVAVAIILLNLYVAVSTGCRLPPLVLSMHFPDVAASIYVEAVPAVPHE